MSEEAQVEPGMVYTTWPGPEVTDGVFHSGLIRVAGVDYHLPSMPSGALTELHAHLAGQAKDIRDQLAERDVERQLTGSLLHDALVWRNAARHAQALKKKQMGSIHSEYARRKSEMPPIEGFYLAAVRQLYGEIGEGKVKARAREMHENERHNRELRSRVTQVYGPENEICGDKIRYETQDLGVAALLSMEARGLNVRGQTCYGPCPYCHQFHTGHAPFKMRQRSRPNKPSRSH